jgi:hypothetical protein
MDKKNNAILVLAQKREQLKLSINDVVNELKNRGIELSAKTLYGYENGVGYPKANTFIALCDIYGIDDVLSSFGYKSKVPIASGETEWSIDLYNDFFNSSMLDKIYILLRNGVPSFEGYEERLTACFPDDATVAGINKIINIYNRFILFLRNCTSI